MSDGGATPVSSSVFGWITDWIGAFFDKARMLGAALVGRIMTGLGLHLSATHWGLPDLFGFLSAHNSLSATLASYMAYLNIPKAISMIVSAYVARAIVRLFLSPLAAATPGGGGTSL